MATVTTRLLPETENIELEVFVFVIFLSDVYWNNQLSNNSFISDQSLHTVKDILPLFVQQSISKYEGSSSLYIHRLEDIYSQIGTLFTNIIPIYFKVFDPCLPTWQILSTRLYVHGL